MAPQSFGDALPRAMSAEGMGEEEEEDRTTYLCGGILDDLCLIGQSLLLQGK